MSAIAARAGVGIGSLYRRYASKDALFQHLAVISLDQHLHAAEEGLEHDDPWDGLAHYVTSAISFGTAVLNPIAGTVDITDEMADKNTRSDRAVEELVRRAHDAGVLRPDVTAVDIALLIEQLSRSPLTEQLGYQGRADLNAAACNARSRIVAIALDGLRTGAPHALPGQPPGYELFTERWARPER